MGEFKNGQISVSSIILSNVPGRIQDGVEVFESAEWRKLHGRMNNELLISKILTIPPTESI